MIPILYDASETLFSSQGIGALQDAVSCKISRVLNGKDELVMVYPSSGLRYADIANDKIIFAQPEYRKSPQPYQIYHITKPLNGLVSVYARHVCMHRSAYIPVKPFEAGSVTEALASLPNNMLENNPFTFWTDKSTVANFKLTRPATLGNVLGGMEGSLLDVYGGEYDFDKYTIKLLDQRGVDSGVELRYGKNITKIEQAEDWSNVITGICPYWQGFDGESVWLPEYIIENAQAGSYPFKRTIVKDFTERFEEKPTVEQLRASATSYVNASERSVPKVDLTVNFEHLAQYAGYENMELLETLNLGDSVSIFYEPLGISATARIVKSTYDCLNEKYDTINIGSVRSSLSQIMNGIVKEAETARESTIRSVPSAISEAVENATDLITGANGGYVVIDRDANGKPYQILIMDTDNKSTATNVIRINQNGIGFSTSGYSGPFTTAWTIDGSFVADFITTGVLNAALAKIGLLADAAGKNSWNMETGAFNITEGSINITTNSETNDIINLIYHTQWGDAETTLMPYGMLVKSAIQNTMTDISGTGFATMREGTTPGDWYPTAQMTAGGIILGSADYAVQGGVTQDGYLRIYDASGVLREEHQGEYARVKLYDSNGNEMARYPDGVNFNGDLSPYSSRGTIDYAVARKWGLFRYINIVFTASYTGSSSTARIIDVGADNTPGYGHALSCVDVTSGSSYVDSSIPCKVGTTGGIYANAVTNGHKYVITGLYFVGNQNV